jgi:dynactin complex subunit
MNRKTSLLTEPRLNKQRQKLSSDKVIEALKVTYLAKEKAELLVSDLEKLKAETSAIEAQYNILKDDYSKMCDDAISRITAVKTALEKDIESKVGDLEVFQSGISNLEARFKLGLVPPETYSKEKKTLAKKDVTPPARPKPARDKQMDLLELGLDGIGDGIIWLGERMIGMFSSKSKNHHPKS